MTKAQAVIPRLLKSGITLFNVFACRPHNNDMLTQNGHLHSMVCQKTDVEKGSRPDAAEVRETILANRRDFVAYNIARVRELIRYLPEKKMDMFCTVPLLLHINAPDWPGFAAADGTPHGICGFYDSGFWKLAKKRLGIEQKQIRTFVSRAFYIKGVYLMGSAGSLGQTDYSDFDYWVVVDGKMVGPEQRALLRKKLRLIEKWGRDTFDHAITFFVLDREQIQRNDFSGMDEEGFRIAQRTLLKEEFYRTFILIAGQIPYWAVAPSGLTDNDYGAWIETASGLSGEGFASDEYVDLGNLSAIEMGECLGAVLWQFGKAQDDPVKALIKATLIAHHYFFQQKEGLLCDVTKTRMAESQLDSYLLDPYALAFERVLRFYQNTEDQEGLHLIRDCIYLRITGYPAPFHAEQDNPKRQLLQRYVREWSWNEERVARLASHASWTESERLRFEDGIIKKLWSLYTAVLRRSEAPGAAAGNHCEDVVALKNKASSRLKKKPGKLPSASVSLRARGDRGGLFIEYRRAAWAVFEGAEMVRPEQREPAFSAPELLHILGWVVLNGLYRGDPATVTFHPVQSPVSPTRCKQLLDQVYAHYLEAIPPSNFRETEPRWHRMFVVLDTSRFPGDNSLRCVDYLLQNTWGEMFFHSMDLRDVANRLLKYHAIAECVWQHLQGTDWAISYRVFDLRTVEDRTIDKTIRESLETIRQQVKAAGEAEAEKRLQRTVCTDGLLLDLF
jgi:adenylate cyclase class 1